MTNLDALLAGGQTLAATHDAVDRLTNAGITYGPGLLLGAGAIAAWRCCRWAARRYRAWVDRRVIAHLTYLDDLQNRLTARLKAQTQPAIETNPGPINTTYLQLEGMYAAPDYTHEGDR